MKDLRFQKNDRRIRQEFTNLLLRKNYESITVNEICRLAEVNRSTFYDHFENKDDLLKTTTENFMNQFSEEIIACITSDEPGKTLMEIFHLSEERATIFRVALKLHNEQFLKQAFAVHLNKGIEKAHLKFKTEDYRILYVNYFSALSIETIKWWLDYGMNGNRYEEIADIIMGTLNSGLNHTLIAPHTRADFSLTPRVYPPHIS